MVVSECSNSSLAHSIDGCVVGKSVELHAEGEGIHSLESESRLRPQTLSGCPLQVCPELLAPLSSSHRPTLPSLDARRPIIKRAARRHQRCTSQGGPDAVVPRCHDGFYELLLRESSRISSRFDTPTMSRDCLHSDSKRPGEPNAVTPPFSALPQSACDACQLAS